MKETLSTIATRTGLSITTVSRVLSGNADRYRISKDTQAKVIREARLCNYHSGAPARKGRTGMVGLLLPSVSNPYFAEMAQTLIYTLRQSGYTSIVMDTMEDEDMFNDSMCSLAARRVDGMIVVPCGADCTIPEKIEAEGTPVVLIDRFYQGTRLPYVTTDNYQGGLEATRFLISRGHRDIACIQGIDISLPNQERVAGYRDAMAEAGIAPLINVVGNDFSTQNGYIETSLLLCRSHRPSAIFALSNTIAIGAIKAIRETGLRIPGDISLITFDNNIYLDYLEPAITRISQPVPDMARLAVKILLERVNCASSSYSHLRLSPTMIQGASVAFIKQ